MKIVPSVACQSTDGVGNNDANGNNCASYADLSSCTDCLCDVSDDTMSFIANTMCCACGGGAGCSKTETLEILDNDTNEWITYD